MYPGINKVSDSVQGDSKNCDSNINVWQDKVNVEFIRQVKQCHEPK